MTMALWPILALWGLRGGLGQPQANAQGAMAWPPGEAVGALGPVPKTGPEPGPVTPI